MENGFWSHAKTECTGYDFVESKPEVVTRQWLSSISGDVVM